MDGDGYTHTHALMRVCTKSHPSLNLEEFVLGRNMFIDSDPWFLLFFSLVIFHMIIARERLSSPGDLEGEYCLIQWCISCGCWLGCLNSVVFFDFDNYVDNGKSRMVFLHHGCLDWDFSKSMEVLEHGVF